MIFRKALILTPQLQPRASIFQAVIVLLFAPNIDAPFTPRHPGQTSPRTSPAGYWTAQSELENNVHWMLTFDWIETRYNFIRRNPFIDYSRLD